MIMSNGEYFDFERPEDASFDIRDIAHSLSMICRFGGQCPSFYSVAEHSVLVSRLVPKHLRKQAILHDSPEFILGDMIKPIKVRMPEYNDYEEKLWNIIADRFNVPREMDPLVIEADITMLATEQKYVMYNVDNWEFTRGKAPNDSVKPRCLAPMHAKNLFLIEYIEIMKEENA